MDDDGPPGVAEWVVTYGDMMSLLLTFFIMLVSLSEVQADKKFRAVLESLHKRFGYQTSVLAPPGDNFPLNSTLERLATLGSYTNDDDGSGGIKVRGMTGVDFRVFRNREGTGVPVGKPIDFAAGSSNLSREATPNLDEIAREVAGLPNLVEVHGLAPPPADPHAESAAETEERTRQLCFERAKSVRDALIARGIDPERVRIVVDTRDPGLATADPSERVTGERVQVFELDAHATDFVGDDED